MKIETKFNVGDRVWYIGLNPNLNWCVQDSFNDVIEGITSDKELQIVYIFSVHTEHERHCFATREEAQAECDKRNYETEYKQIFEKCLDEAIEKTVNKGE